MKTKALKILSFFVALSLVAVGFFIKYRAEKAANAQNINNIYTHELNTLCNSLSDIGAELEKAQYITTAPLFCETAARIYKHSGLALSSLSRLPQSENTEELYKFLSQTGDYSLYLSGEMLASPITEAERANLAALKNIANRYTAEAERMRIDFIQSGEFDFPNPHVTSETQKEEPENEYPTLIYDGPYSDHIARGESYLLESSDEITADEALRLAAAAMKVEQTSLTLAGETGGKVPSYRFENGDMSVSITKRGGYLIYFRKYREPQKPLYTYSQAVKRAEDWLAQYTNMSFHTSYYVVDEGVCTVNFAYKEGSTVCYTDLIKVGVALDNGEFVLCEAGGYIMNHRPRTIKTPDKTVDEARAVVSEKLEILSTSRVLIPSDGKKEIPCYEFVCKTEQKEEILVYVNSDTLEEERIYLVVNAEGGSLVK